MHPTGLGTGRGRSGGGRGRGGGPGGGPGGGGRWVVGQGEEEALHGKKRSRPSSQGYRQRGEIGLGSEPTTSCQCQALGD